MPYIKQERRRHLNIGKLPETAGELNYVLTKAVHHYMDAQHSAGRAIGYEAFNSAIGALECAKLELYRRFIAPYEDHKIVENGDVP